MTMNKVENFNTYTEARILIVTVLSVNMGLIFELGSVWFVCVQSLRGFGWELKMEV